jgi:hypothetical protein
LIRPVLLYSRESWVLPKREENQLLVFERKVLRTICGPKIENAVYRTRYSHELKREFDSPNVLNVTKTCRLRYAGHMIRKPEDLPQKLYSDLNSMEGEIKEDRNPRGQMG